MDIEHFKVGSGIRRLAKQLQKADHPETMDITPAPERSLHVGFADDDIMVEDEEVMQRYSIFDKKMAILGAKRRMKRGGLLSASF